MASFFIWLPTSVKGTTLLVLLFCALFFLQEVNTIDDKKEVLKGFHALF
jgi:hypothetical protein